MKKIFESIPKFFIGPLAVIIGIVYFMQQDPPKTICDTQFEIFKDEKSIKKYVYSFTDKKFEIPPGIQKNIENCQNTNSPGGCFDWMEGMKRVIHTTRALPMQCRDRLGELDPLKKWFDLSIFLYSQISWNDSTIVSKSLFNWLSKDDVLLYCRVKTEYTRLWGEGAYKGLEVQLLRDLQKLKKLPAQRTWERTVLSYKCPILNT